MRGKSVQRGFTTFLTVVSGATAFWFLLFCFRGVYADLRCAPERGGQYNCMLYSCLTGDIYIYLPTEAENCTIDSNGGKSAHSTVCLFCSNRA